jgi:lysophospholipase L1-like esterase
MQNHSLKQHMPLIPSRFIRRFLTTALLALCSFLSLASATQPVPFADGDRVLFLGDSITRGGGWHSQISLFYETRFPTKRITWLNAGISGDTSGGAVQRLSWDVMDRQPDTVVIMLGMNDAARDDLPSELGMGEVGSAKRVAEYAKNTRSLIEKLQAAKVKIILCTPSPYDATVQSEKEGNPAANQALTEMTAVCRELAKEFDVAVVDFNKPMNAITAAYQKSHPRFTLIGGDRVHPGELGNTVMAHLFFDAQQVNGLISETAIDAAKGELTLVENATVSELKADNGTLSFTLLENALPMPLVGDARQALKLSPENELLKTMAKLKDPADAFTRGKKWWNTPEDVADIKDNEYFKTSWDEVFWRDRLHRQILTVTGLPEGEYELLIDDQPVGRWFDDDLRAGVNLSGVRATPQYRQAEKVAAAHAKRHKAASSSPRMMAFTRHFNLIPAGVDETNPAAVQTYLETLIDDPTAKERIEFGSYALRMAQKYLEYQSKEAETTTTIAAADDEIYTLNQPVARRYELRPVTHPLSLDVRQSSFAARSQPQQLAALSKEFLDLLVLDKKELLRSNLRRRPGLQKVADLADADKPTEALEAFRDYFFDKLRNGASYGLSEALLDPYKDLINMSKKEATLARAEELMAGKVVANAASMQPGSVWSPRPKERATGAKNPWTPEAFQPLVVAYLITAETRFLTKWTEYLDDWAMFENTDDGIRATDISDSDNKSVSQVMAVYKALGGIARLPGGQATFPADTLARVLSKFIRVYLPLAIVYHDSNPQNWTPGSTARMMQVAALMDEFKAAETIFARARHRHENYGTIQNLPDGSETEHALWYNAHYFDGALDAVELIGARRHVSPWKQPTWEAPAMDTVWEQGQREKIIERARYFLQMLTPQSQYPIGNRSDQRTLPDWKSKALVDYASLNGAADLNVLLNTLRGNTAAGLPDFTMSAFPYSGSWLMRNGWSKNDGYAHFFCSPYPVGGHAMRGLKSNNSLYLSNDGQDLLVSGGFGSYSYDRSPLRVDAQEQFAHAGIGNPGINKNHKGFAVAYIDPQPANWRSHSSQNFDFAEGVYSGPYGDFVDDHHDNKDYRSGFLAERAREVITGVSHQRQVFHVKNPDLWIVVDRLQSPQAHEYTLDWFLPAPLEVTAGNKAHTKYKGKTFAEADLSTDITAQSLLTTAKDMPNLSIRHFGPKLSFERTAERGEAIKNDYTYHYKMYDFWCLSGSWQSEGDDIVISLIEVIPNEGSSSIAKVTKREHTKNGSGFELLTHEGQSIVFNATLDGSVELKQGTRGLVLGKHDYEFNGAVETPIYRPIAPVQIEPARTVIAGTEPVTITCATPDVEIRYTLDGTVPTIQSPRYSAPLSITNKVTVNARAFRAGLSKTPSNLAGTHATVTAVAHYNLQLPLGPVAQSGDKRYAPGLNADYYEGNWKDLAFFPENVTPQKSFNARWLFDRCRPSNDKTFAWNYTGFLDVPADGVYTFHAPEEMVTSPQEPGYNLRLFVGQELLYNNRPSGRLNEWYPATSRHGYGTWSVALKKGLHPFKLNYVDYRADAVERLNHPGLRLNTIWDGAVPELLVSGPGIEPQPIPQAWLYKTKAKK